MLRNLKKVSKKKKISVVIKVVKLVKVVVRVAKMMVREEVVKDLKIMRLHLNDHLDQRSRLMMNSMMKIISMMVGIEDHLGNVEAVVVNVIKDMIHTIHLMVKILVAMAVENHENLQRTKI